MKNETRRGRRKMRIKDEKRGKGVEGEAMIVFEGDG